MLVRQVEGDGSLTNITAYDYDLSQTIPLLRRIDYPEGKWEYFTYDSQRRIDAHYTGYADGGPPSGAPEFDIQTVHYKVVEYSYATNIPGEESEPEMRSRLGLARREITKVPAFDGSTWTMQEVSRLYRAVTAPNKIVEIRCPNPGAAWNDPANVWSKLTEFGDAAATNTFGRPQYRRHEDGTVSLYDYQFNGSGILTNTIVLQGEPGTTPTMAIDATNVVNGTRMETRLNSLGQVTLQTLQAITNGTVSVLLASETYTYSGSLQRDYTVVNLAGRTNQFQYACCGLDSVVDPDGITTLFEYDYLRRQVATTTLRGGSGVKTTNLLDTIDRVLQTRRIGTDSTSITMEQFQYDLLGRAVSQTNALSGITSATNTIVDGRLVSTTTYPDTGTRIEAFYRDGRSESNGGTAVFPVKYIYGAQQDGSNVWREFTLEIKLKDSDTNEWVKTFYDGLGNPCQRVYAAASGTPTSKSFYNDRGQLWKQVDPDDVTSFYTYDGEGRQEYAILATTNSTQQISTYTNLVAQLSALKAGADRITQTVRAFLPAAGGKPDLVRRDTYVWKDGSSTGTLVSRFETSTDGLKSWQIVYPNPSSPATNSTVIAYANGGWRTNTATAVDGSTTINVYSYGLLKSTTRKDSAGSQLSALTYTYDAHDRQNTITDARNGTTTFAYNSADETTSVTSPDPLGLPQLSLYDSVMRPTGTRNPDGNATTNVYHKTGLQLRNWGSRIYPVGYGYDAQGRMQYMTNWQNFSGESGMEATRWNYDAYRGWLSSKDYANASTGVPEADSGPVYTYSAAGRLKTRTWKRGITTTYSYNAAGDLQTVVYSDSTPSTTNSYDRLGRLSQQSTINYQQAFTYNDIGQVVTNAFTGGIMNGLSLTNGYDTFMRRMKLTARYSTTPLLQNSYSYDASSRLSTVTNGVYSAAYSYVANSPLISQISFKSNTTVRMTTTKSYDVLNRLTSIQSSNSQVGVISSHAYQYNAAGQRTRATLADGSYWLYEYDSLGQVKSGKRYWSDGTPVAGQQFEYNFDDIGNRTSTKAGGDDTGGNLRSASYTANRLNQYTQRDVPGYLDILGIANPTAAVTVSSNTAYRKGEYFHFALPVDNSATAQYPSVKVVSAYGSTQTNTGNVFLPKTPEVFSYDGDGNLTNDGRWSYTWDAENRLVKMETNSPGPIPDGAKRKLEFWYDAQGRRIQKSVSIWTNSAWSLVLSNRFLYDGWNPVAELNATNNNLIRSYVSGLDLSGTEQGAGGVGGLLMVLDEIAINNQPSAHFAVYDGNGNLTSLLNARDASASAIYEYGPFAEPIRGTGAMALINPFRFSSKFTDDETSLLYYGQRFYNVLSGRWLSRDPLGDVVFLRGYITGKPQSEVRDLTRESLMPPYQFVRNDAVDKVDQFGLSSEADVSWAPAPCPQGQVTAFIQVVVGYKWSDGGPHVDNGSLGPKSSKSSGCPLYPLPPNLNQVFQDSPSGWTGDLQFIVCRVCLEYCGSCKRYTRGGRGGRTVYADYKIVSVGPCVYWKKGDKGDLSDKDNFTHVDGPNQNWQVGMDTDFPNASKGGCFTCSGQ